MSETVDDDLNRNPPAGVDCEADVARYERSGNGILVEAWQFQHAVGFGESEKTSRSYRLKMPLVVADGDYLRAAIAVELNLPKRRCDAAVNFGIVGSRRAALFKQFG